MNNNYQIAYMYLPLRIISVALFQPYNFFIPLTLPVRRIDEYDFPERYDLIFLVEIYFDIL